MSDHHFWLSEAQFARLKPLLPNKPRGVPRVDDRRVIRGGLMWRDAPAVFGPPKTLYNRFIRWSRIGVFDRIFAALAGESTSTDTVMIDATHRRQPAQKGAVPRRIERTKGGLNSKLHAVYDGDVTPLILLLTEGQVSDYRGAATVLSDLPDAEVLIADKGVEARLVPSGPVRFGHHALHSRAQEPQDAGDLRRQDLQAAQSGRAHSRQAQGLAQDSNPI
jgi:transposase